MTRNSPFGFNEGNGVSFKKLKLSYLKMQFYESGSELFFFQSVQNLASRYPLMTEHKIRVNQRLI